MSSSDKTIVLKILAYCREIQKTHIFFQDKKEFFKSIKDKNCFIEELVVQDEKWGSLSPNSINTLRVMTGAVNRKI